MGQRGRSRGRKRNWQPEAGRVVALDDRGRGVIPAGAEGKPREARVEGTLPGEQVSFLRHDREGPVDAARPLEIIEPAPERVEPRCVHYGVCGGCSLMHMDPDAQVAHKQALLLADFAAHGLTPERVLAPLRAEPWAYRRRARLGAKWVPGKDKVVVGFREKDRRFIADLGGCEILAGQAGALIPRLSEVLAGLSVANKIPQIEVSVADDDPQAAIALVLRVLEPPSEDDRARLRGFARDHALRLFLQPAGLDSVAPLDADTPLTLDYHLPSHELRLRFRPVDFVQVNAAINRAMIDLALELLEVAPSHRVLDLFCGLGNFSLPLARRAHAGAVLGVEGDRGLVEAARANAEQNHLDNVRFEVRDLYGDGADLSWLGEPGQPSQPSFDRVLLDPPRSGAAAIVEHFATIAAPRVVYVACSPSSLARDAAVLVGRHGYRLQAAGVMDMFPHTAHVESIALFVR